MSVIYVLPSSFTTASLRILLLATSKVTPLGNIFTTKRSFPLIVFTLSLSDAFIINGKITFWRKSDLLATFISKVVVVVPAAIVFSAVVISANEASPNSYPICLSFTLSYRVASYAKDTFTSLAEGLESLTSILRVLFSVIVKPSNVSIGLSTTPVAGNAYSKRGS